MRWTGCGASSLLVLLNNHSSIWARTGGLRCSSGRASSSAGDQRIQEGGHRRASRLQIPRGRTCSKASSPFDRLLENSNNNSEVIRTRREQLGVSSRPKAWTLSMLPFKDEDRYYFARTEIIIGPQPGEDRFRAAAAAAEDPDLLEQRLQSLEQNGCQALVKEAAAGKVGRESVEDLFRTAFHILRLRLDNAMNPRDSVFLVSFVRRLYPHLSSLQPGEVLFYLVLCGVFRKLPCNDYNAVKGNQLGHSMGFPIPDHVEDASVNCLEASTDIEAGILAHSMFASHLYLRTPNRRLKTLLLDSLERLGGSGGTDHQRQGGELWNFAVVSLAKFLKNRGSFDRHKVEAIASAYLPSLSRVDLDICPLIRLTDFLSSTCSVGCPMLAEFAGAIKRKLPEVTRVKDLERVAFILYWLDYRDPEFFDALLDSVQGLDMSDPRSGRSLVFLYYFCGLSGHIRSEELGAIFKVVNQSLELGESEYGRRPLQPFDVLSRLGNSSLSRKLEALDKKHQLHEGPEDDLRHVLTRAKKISNDLKRGENLNVNALAAIAQLDYLLDLPPGDHRASSSPVAASSTRLKENVKARLLAPFLAQRQEGLLTSREDEKIDALFQGLKSKLGGSEDLVYCGYLLPSSNTREIVVRLGGNLEGNPRPLPKAYLETLLQQQSCCPPKLVMPKAFDDDPMMSSEASSSVWCAVFVPRRKWIDRNGQLFGPAASRVRHLTSAGYKVLVMKNLATAHNPQEEQSQDDHHLNLLQQLCSSAILLKT